MSFLDQVISGNISATASDPLHVETGLALAVILEGLDRPAFIQAGLAATLLFVLWSSVPFSYLAFVQYSTHDGSQ